MTKAATPQPDDAFDAEAIAVTRALGGKVGGIELLRAHITKTEGESRPQQELMVDAVADAIDGKHALLAQAGTGTGKSLAYLFPLAASGKRGIIATATNQLSEQLIRHDLPEVAETLAESGKEIEFTLLKGRNNYACFGGDEQFLTRTGVMSFIDAVGKTVTVCDGNGDWTDAEIRPFGRQEIVELHVSRRGIPKVIRTTAEHRWFVEPNANFPNSTQEAVTVDLQPGQSLKYVRPQNVVRHTGLRPSPFGIAHGIVFGDGTRFAPTANGFVTSTITLFGEKNRALLKYFNNAHSYNFDPGEEYSDRLAIRVTDLPRAYKQFPDLSEAPSVLYGWLAGYFAADGHVDASGRINLSSAVKANLDFVSQVCALLGIGTGSILVANRVGKSSTGESTPLYSINLEGAHLTTEFFIIDAHRVRYEARMAKWTYKQERSARRWKVDAVVRTGEYEDVYCAVVPTTQSFALTDGILTGNCLAKTNEIDNLNRMAGDFDANDTLFEPEQVEETSSSKRKQAREDAAEVGKLVEWSRTSPSGDRSEAPIVADRVWQQVSTTAADCVGANNCPFGATCFTEIARMKAKQADIVVTNHALVAQEVKIAVEDARAGVAGGGELFGKRDVLIVDEAHDLPDALTGALSTEVDGRAIAKFLGKAARYIDDDDIDKDGEPKSVALARNDVEELVDYLGELPEGALNTLPQPVTDLISAVVSRFIVIAKMLTDAAGKAAKDEQPKRAAVINTLVIQANAYMAALTEARTVGPGRVRWVDRRRPEDHPILRTAPLEVGDALRLAIGDRSFIATSATLTVGGDFTPIRRTLGLEDDSVVSIDVGSPFDYPKQGMLYIPKPPFPEPVGKERTAHTEAVLKETLALVTASGGRALVLTTTTVGAQRTAEYLREHLPHLMILAHGDAPADLLVRQFADEETSVLCATMGLWQGTNVPGASCSLVVIDKVGFAPVDDVLTGARRALADSRRRDGFTEVVVAQAATSLAQAAGRLIRTQTDKGVVAILDPRLLSKGYGKTLIKSLPNFGLYSDLGKVTAALERLTGGTTDEHRAQPPAPKPELSGFARRQGSASSTGSGLRRSSSTKGIAKKNLRPKKID